MRQGGRRPALTWRAPVNRAPGGRPPSPRGSPRWGSLRAIVYAILRQVPRGKVVTYGQLALLAGNPWGARQVGWIAHAGGEDLPWQRVVNRFGGLASGYRGGRAGHKADLEDDGVRVREDFTVDLERYQWWPPSRVTAAGRGVAARPGQARS